MLNRISKEIHTVHDNVKELFRGLLARFALPTEKVLFFRVAVISAKNHKRQRRKRQSVTAKREKSQMPKFLTAILTLPNLT